MYYRGLPAIDLFGKTDKHIARITPTRAFRPGHNKVDYGYSIDTLRPDVVFMGLDEPEIESWATCAFARGCTSDGTHAQSTRAIHTSPSTGSHVTPKRERAKRSYFGLGGCFS